MLIIVYIIIVANLRNNLGSFVKRMIVSSVIKVTGAESFDRTNSRKEINLGKDGRTSVSVSVFILTVFFCLADRSNFLSIEGR